MEEDYEKKIKQITEKLLELEEGDNKAQSLAFECLGILSNELTSESYESRLQIVEKMIEEYEKNKNSN